MPQRRSWLSVLPLLGVAMGVSALRAAEPYFSESFDDPRLTARGWYDGERFVLGQNPFAGAGCLEFHWRAGDTKPQYSQGARHAFPPTDTVYVRFYQRLSPGWGWTGRNYHPHLLQFLTTANGDWDGPAATHLTTYVEPVAARLRLAAQDIQNQTAPHGLTQGELRGGYNGQLYDSAEKLFVDDRWHLVEAMFKLNTVDPATGTWQRNGELRAWFDERLVIERTDVVFRSVDFPDMRFDQFLMLPYFGPGLLPHAQTLWLDELAVGPERLGPVKR